MAGLDKVVAQALSEADLVVEEDEPTLRRVGNIRVKGREVPLDVFTTIPPGFTPENMDSYNEGVRLLEAGKHNDAGIIFKELYNDELSMYQLSRCENGEGATLTLTDK